MGISEQTFYRWKKQYSGIVPSDLKNLSQLIDTNSDEMLQLLFLELNGRTKQNSNAQLEK